MDLSQGETLPTTTSSSTTSSTTTAHEPVVSHDASTNATAQETGVRLPPLASDEDEAYYNGLINRLTDFELLEKKKKLNGLFLFNPLLIHQSLKWLNF